MCSFKKGNEQNGARLGGPFQKLMVLFQILRCNELDNSVVIIKLLIFLQTSNSYFPLSKRIGFKQMLMKMETTFFN